MEGGIVSASAAGRQLQAILSKLSGDHGDNTAQASSAHSAEQQSAKPQTVAKARRKQLSQKG